MGHQIKSLEDWQYQISQPREMWSAHLRQLEEQGISYQDRWSGVYYPISHPDPRMYSGQWLTYLSPYMQGEFSAQGVDVSGLVAYYHQCIGKSE